MTPGQRREQAGRRAETLAAVWLRLKGWRILARRVRTGRGEIDLVARRGTHLIFVEVKWRARGDPTLLDSRRYRRVWAAAQMLAPRFAIASDQGARLDLVILAPWRWPRHIPDIRPAS